MMTLPDGAEIHLSWPSRDADNHIVGHTYRVSRDGKTIGEFASLNDVARFVRYRHDQPTHDAFIKSHEYRPDTAELLASALRTNDA
jgi:hypothetical protein